jgi:toxin FitB
MELVDTNILSELFRPRPNSGVLDWKNSVSEIAISVITVDEIAFGLAHKPNERLEREIASLLKDGITVLPIDSAIATRAGQLRGRFRREGINRTSADMLIAATALHHNLTLVTRNERDFSSTGIQVKNPFQQVP